MILQDLRYGLRSMMKTPAFFAVAVATLALGIGANTAMFSVVNAVLLRPLPYQEPDRLVFLREINPLLGGDQLGVSWPNFKDWREASRSFESLAAIYTTQATISDERTPEAERVPVALVSAELFGLLRVRPALGREFLPEEDRPGAANVAIVSDGLWKRRFGERPGTVGESIEVSGTRCAIVGVMPAGFTFLQDDIQVWAPLGPITPQLDNRSVHVLAAVGRLAGGTTIAQAALEIDAIAAGIQEQRPGEDPGHGALVEPLHGRVVSGIRPALLVLTGAVGFVLLIACGNIANLLLARTASRRREIAIRAALGAGRGRILRQMLTESVLLSAFGGAMGLILALWGTDLLAGSLPDFIPRRETISVDGAVLLFTMLISLLTGLLFGLAPALDACRFDLSGAMRKGAAIGGTLSSRGGLRSAMVIAQVALSLVLLAGAGVMIRSYWRLQNVDPGFDTSGLLILKVSLPTQKYDDAAKVIGFYRDLQHSLEMVPGVTAASAVSSLPISGGDGQGDLTVEGRPFPPGEAPGASFRRVMPSYFKVMGIPLLRGREFDDRDGGGNADQPKVVIINESMARRFWPGEDPTGRRIKVGPADGEPWLTIVGVVGDVLNVGLDAQPGFATYEPHAQRPWSTMTLALRTANDPLSLAAAAREVIRRAEPAAPVFGITTMEGRISESLALRRFNTGMMRLFSAVALLLAAIGIYGVLAYSVSRRAGEFGIRMALGASGRDLLRLVICQGMTLAMIGVAIGLAAAFALTRLLSTLLFEVSATDPATFAAVALIMTIVALASCYIPARRATRVDPMVALRDE